MHKVVAVTNNNKWQLIGQLGLLQEVLDTLRGVAVGLAADPLNLLDLTGLAGSLDILEVHFRILKQLKLGRIIRKHLDRRILNNITAENYRKNRSDDAFNTNKLDLPD